MSHFTWRQAYFFLLLLVRLTHEAGSATTSPTDHIELERPGWISWIERPWTTRYFIAALPSNDWRYIKEAAIRDNAKSGQKFFDWQEFFTPATLPNVKPDPASGEHSLSVVVIDFDKNGLVVSPHSHQGSLRGRLNRLLRVGLSEGEAMNDRYFELASLFTGIGDASTHWAPAFCNGYQRPDPATVKSEDYLYGKYFKPTGYAPLFGCREWAYQLYDNERPYIDVTSYEPTSKGKPPKPYIRKRPAIPY